MVDAEIAQLLQGHLANLPDGPEPLMWTGRPRVWLTLTWRDVLGRFPLFLMLVTPFWVPMAIALDGRGSFAPASLWLSIPVLVVVMRFAAEAYVRRGTVYGLTHTYALALRSVGPGGFRFARAHQPSDLAHGVFGGGTIQFEYGSKRAMSYGRAAPFVFAFRSVTFSGGVWFEGLGDADAVIRLLVSTP